MSNEESAPLGELRELLYDPLSKERWAQAVTLLSELPKGEDQEMAFSYFIDHLKSTKEKTQAAAGEEGSFLGLWKVTAARQQSGSVNSSQSFECDTINDLREFEEVEQDISWSVEEELLYFLEIHEDGTYKEVDLTQGPLTATNENAEVMAMYTDEADLEAFCEEMGLEQAGLVSAMAGYEHSFKTDIDGYATSSDPQALEGATELVLHEHHDDEWVEDRVNLESATILKRRGYVLWDGAYTKALLLEYELVARFEGRDFSDDAILE